MQLDIDFPLLFRARPSGSRNIQNVHVSHKVRATVPEISASEVSTALSLTLGDQAFELKEHDGRYYRKALYTGWSARDAFDSPFKHDYFRKRPPLFEDRLRADYPASAAVLEHQRWWLDAFVFENLGDREAWPPHRPARIWNRSQEVFGDLKGKLNDISVEDYSVALRMNEVMIGKLLVIGGEMYVESEPPAWRVRPTGSKQSPTFQVFLQLAPNKIEQDLYSATFPLSREEEAIEYAALRTGREEAPLRPGEIPRRSDVRSGGASKVVSAEIITDDLSKFDFEYREDVVQRFAMAVTQGCAKFLANNEAGRDLVSAHEAATLETALAEMKKTNYVLGTRGQTEDYLPTLLPVWERLKSPMYRYVDNIMNVDRRDLRALMLDRVAEGVIDIFDVPAPRL